MDVDRKGDRSGFAAWNELKRAGLAGEPQAVIRTPSGGMHAYYKGTQQRNGHLPEHADRLPVDRRLRRHPAQQGRGRPAVRGGAQAGQRGHSRLERGPAAPRPAAASGSPQRAPQRDADTAARRRPPGRLGGRGSRRATATQGLFWAANRAVEAGDTETLGKLATAAREAGLDDREIDRTIRSAQQGNHGSARPFAREQAATGQRVPSPRADIERATAAATAAARSHKEAEPEREPEHDRHR